MRTLGIEIMTIATRLPALTAFLLIASPAYAHFGHVGELAGHSHWIGLAAAAAAAVIATAVTVQGKKDKAAKEDKADTATEDGATADDTNAVEA
jgi:chromate transport protein ChrA